MGFWVFMLCMGWLFPVMMLVMGKVFTKSAPKNINYVFGYRTERSMKNKDTWEFAHKYIGRLWLRLGWILLPVMSVPMFFVIGKDKDIVGTLGAALCLLGLFVLIGSILPVERALKRNFDEDGNRKAAQ